MPQNNTTHPLAQRKPKLPRKPSGFAAKPAATPLAPIPAAAPELPSESPPLRWGAPLPPVESGSASGLMDLPVGEDPGCLPVTEVFDEADQAQWLNLRELAAVQSRARLMNRPETHPDFDGKTCVVCGDNMPKERLVLKRIRCVECQSLLEKKTSPHLYARPGEGR